MTTNAERLLREVLELPSSERLEVFERLGAQLEAEHGEPLSGAWRAELSRRISRLDAGSSELTAVEDVERELWAEQLADESVAAAP